MSKVVPFFSSIARGEALVAALRKGARFSFALTVILIPFRYRLVLASRPQFPIYGDFTDFLLFASDLTLIATLVLWSLSLLLKPRPLKTGPGFLIMPLAGVLGTSLISTFTSVDIPLSIYHFLRLILLFGFFIYVLNEVRTLHQLAIPVSLQILIQALVGVSQFLDQRSVGLALLGELELDPAWSGVSVVWAEGVRTLRAYGLADHPNILGGSLAFALLLLAGWVARTPAHRTRITTGIFALGLVALFLTFSRAAWLAFLIGALFFAEGLRRTRQPQTLAAWLRLLGAGMIILLPFVWQNAGRLGVRLNVGDSFTQITLEKNSISERRELNQAANQLFVENAFTGVGVGAFPTALLVEQPDPPFNYQPPHVALLEAAAETGIFGALFYFLLLGSPWLATWLNRRRIDFSPTFITASSVLAAITIVGFFDYYPWLLAPGRLWQTLMWGFWAASYLQATSSGSHA